VPGFLLAANDERPILAVADCELLSERSAVIAWLL
jgi:hypothetical protein